MTSLKDSLRYRGIPRREALDAAGFFSPQMARERIAEYDHLATIRGHSSVLINKDPPRMDWLVSTLDGEPLMRIRWLSLYAFPDAPADDLYTALRACASRSPLTEQEVHLLQSTHPGIRGKDPVVKPYDRMWAAPPEPRRSEPTRRAAPRRPAAVDEVASEDDSGDDDYKPRSMSSLRRKISL